MSRSALLIAVSGLALAACQPAADAPEELRAETPPVAEEAMDVADAAEEEVSDAAEAVEADIEAAADAVEETVETAAVDADHDHAEDHDHEDEAHAHDDEHEEDHDHEDHEHGDHDHDHAGGEAHVHGLSDLAASIDGSTLSVNVEGALANFDLDESIRDLGDTTPYTGGTVEIIGGDCTSTSAEASVRPIGDHGNMIIDLTYDCGAPDAIEAINVTGFASFAGFEEVNAVFLTDAGQTAETLTKSDTRLDIN